MKQEQLESEIVGTIMRKLAKIEQCWAMNVHGGLYQKIGIPDIIGCYKGRFYAIEVKRPGKEPTTLQYKLLRIITKAGGLAGWTTTLAGAERILEGDIVYGTDETIQDSAAHTVE